jgi:hypothetical protein
MPERLDRIHCDVGGRQVEMPWSVGQELKTRALRSLSTQSIATTCGVTMVPAALSVDEDHEGDWVCLECEELDEER